LYVVLVHLSGQTSPSEDFFVFLCIK
jgi:hypothetical protein